MLPATYRSDANLGSPKVLFLTITALLIWGLPTLRESSTATSQAAEAPQSGRVVSDASVNEAASSRTIKMSDFGDGSPTLTLPVPTDKPATLTLDQLKNGVRQYYQRLRAIAVEYENTSDNAQPRSAHHFAFNGDKRFKSQAFPPHDKPDGPLSVDLTMAFDGEVERSYMPRSNRGQVERKQRYIDSDRYAGEALAIPLEGEKSAIHPNFWMPNALDRRESDWKVNPKLDLIDESECYVLESKEKDRIWIDPSIGYAMRFRERQQDDTHRPSEQRPLLLGYYLGNYRQVGKGIWLPQLIEVFFYTTPKPPDNRWKRVGAPSISKITSLSANEQVPGSLFQLSFPPGTTVIDTINHRYYEIGADGKPHNERVFERPGGQPGAEATETPKQAKVPPTKHGGAPLTARVQSAKNMKQIMLAMLNYQAAQRTFPPAYLADKSGKPLLSWRVVILPYLGAQSLYEQFHLDEPWDSEHNKELVAKMPPVYRQPKGTASEGKTNYLTVRGEKTVFPGDKGIRLFDIIDGLPSTISVVEANDDRAVVWTKPDDFEYDDANPGKGLGGLWPNEFLVALTDGSIQFLKANVDPKTLSALFTRNGREAVSVTDAMRAREPSK